MVHLLYIHPSCNLLYIVRLNRENISIRSSYQLLNSFAHVVQYNEFENVASNCATYVHSILI